MIDETQERPERLMKMAEVARTLGVHYNSIRNWINDGTLPHLKLRPYVIRFRPSDIEALLKDAEKGKGTTGGGAK